MKVLAVQLRPTLCHPMAYSPPDSSIHGIFQARILEWASISFSRESSWRLNLSLPHCRQILYHLSHQGSTKRCFRKPYVKFPSHTHRPTHSWAAPLDSGTADMDNRALPLHPVWAKPRSDFNTQRPSLHTAACIYQKVVLLRQAGTLNTKFCYY